MEKEEDWAQLAAQKTLERLDKFITTHKYLWERSSTAEGLQHGLWMLVQIAEGEVIGTKAYRWLGYAQALMVVTGELYVQDVKQSNKEASDLTREIFDND